MKIEDLAITETGEGLAQRLIVRLAELEKKLERLGEATPNPKPAAPPANKGTGTGVVSAPPSAAPAASTPSAPRASAMAPGVTAEPRVDAARMAKLAAAGDRRALAEYLRLRRKE
ncbi:MAG: hypothetical protein ACREJO_04895 [Phycisphaerales bacterium]